MNNDFQSEKIKLEPNSKPYLLKRIISDGFDTVVIFLLFFTISIFIFSTPLAKTYNEHYDNCTKVTNKDDSVIERFGDDSEAIKRYYDEERFAANLHSFILKALAGFIAEAIILLVFPLVSSTKSTPGKMLTGIMPFCEKKQTKASGRLIFRRFAFIFIIDSVFLYLYTGIFTFILVPIIRLMEMLLNQKNKTLCDAITGITMIEKISYDGIDKHQEEQL